MKKNKDKTIEEALPDRHSDVLPNKIRRISADDFPDEILGAVRLLKENGFKAYLVGGCIRDLVMGKKPFDFDITTNALPEDVMSIFQNVKPTGIKHGTVTAIFSSVHAEITTFRSEASYSDCRHPDSVIFSNRIEDDLSRRDFTINALCYNQDEGLLDLYNGIEDIENGIIRSIGNAHKRFREDALRILRCLRFSATLGFEIEADTQKAMLDCSPLLKNISYERICSEFKKILVSQYTKETLLQYSNVFSVVLPQIFPAENVGNCTTDESDATLYEKYNGPYERNDVYSGFYRSVVAASLCPPDFSIRLAALARQDPECDTQDQVPDAAQQRAKQALRLLKADGKTATRTLSILKNADIHFSGDRRCIKKALSVYGPELLSDIALLRIAENRAYVATLEDKIRKCNDMTAFPVNDPDFKNIKGRMDEDELYLHVLDEIEDILIKCECFSVSGLSVNGNDILDAARVYRENVLISSHDCKVKHNSTADGGKYVSVILELLLNAVIDGRVPNDKVHLCGYIRRILDKLYALSQYVDNNK